MRLPAWMRRPSWSATATMLVVIAAVAPYLSALSYGFVFDDIQNIVQNVWLRDASHLREVWTSQAAGFDPQFATSYYRPMMHTFYMATYAIAGLNPAAFHGVNVLLHAIASVLVFFCGRALMMRFGETRHLVESASFAAALCFAIHPVHVEAVAWVAGITDLSCAVFGLASLWLFVRARSTTELMASAGLMLLALLSKEPAALILPLFVAVEWLSGLRSPRLLMRRLWPAALAFVVYLALRWNALGGFAPHNNNRVSMSLWTSLLAAIELFGRYLRYLLIPYPQNALHPFNPPESLWNLRLVVSVSLIVAAIAGWRFTRNRNTIRLDFLGVVLPLLPVLWIPALGEGTFAERYLYLPSTGLCWLVGLLFAHALSRWPAPRATVAVAAAAALSTWWTVALVQHVPVWRNSLSLWSDAVAKAPNSAAAREYLCFALYDANRFTDAEGQCRQSLWLDPSRVNAQINLGNVLATQGKLAEALVNLDEALRRRPAVVEGWITRGLVKMAQHSPDEALANYMQALTIDPQNAEAHNVLGVAYATLGRLDDARLELQKAVQLAPDREEYRSNLSHAMTMR